MSPIALILIVMIATGLFGGLINYFLAPSEDGAKKSLFRSLTVGMGASFLVPLFLNMISSNLLDVIRGTSTVPGDVSKLFVFAGFCLVAAISSKAFITTISDRVLREAQDARREAQAAQQEVANVQAVIAPIVAKETESDDEGLQHVRLLESVSDPVPEERVLHALVPGRWTLRSLNGVAKETELDQLEVGRLLADLTDRGLVARRTGHNGPRWFITEEGRKAIGES